MTKPPGDVKLRDVIDGEKKGDVSQDKPEQWKWYKLTGTRAKSVKRLIILSDRRLEFISNK